MINIDLIEENFWEVHPTIKYRSPFKQFYDSFEDEKRSSKLAWAAVLYSDVKKSPFRNMPSEDKTIEIESFFLEEEGALSDQRVQNLIEKYPEAVMSESEQYVNIWGEKLRERSLFIKNQEYTLDYFGETDNGKISLIKGNAEQLDRMLANTPKILEVFEKYKNQMMAEDSQGRVRGGREESLVEQKRL